MADQEFLRAEALGEAQRYFARLTTDGQQIVDALSAVAEVAPEVTAMAGLDLRFVESGTILPRAPTAAELASLPAGQTFGGAYRPAGLLQRLAWDRAAAQWITSGEPLVDLARHEMVSDLAQSVQAALSNLTLTALAARAQADGPQIVDGSRWMWEATGTPDGGTVVAAAGGGYWHREFVGPVYAPWFGTAGDGVTLDDEPMGRAARAAIGYRAALDLDDRAYVLKQVEILAGVTVQNGKVLSDVTNGGTSVASSFFFNGQDTSAGKTRATMEARRIYDIVFRNVEFDGRRSQMYDITGFGDGARALVAVWGRASRILFDRCILHDAGTDAVMLLTNDGQSVTSTIPAERIDFDPCFVDVEFRDCKIFNNRRCGISADGFQNIRLTGSTEIYGNGLPLPGEPILHGTAATTAQQHDGRQGALVQSGGLHYYYGWGVDAEGYNIGSCSRGLYVAPTVKIYGNAGQAVQVMVNDTEGQDARFEPWGDIQVYGEVGKGVYNSENEAVTLVAFRPAGHDHLAGPSFVDVDISPRVLTGLIGVRQTSRYRVAPGAAFGATDTGAYLGRVFGSARDSSGGVIVHPTNDLGLRFDAGAKLRGRVEGTLPDPFVLPSVIYQSADPATITLTRTVLSRDSGRLKLRFAGQLQAQSGGGWTVFGLDGLLGIPGTPYVVDSVTGSVQDTNSGRYRVVSWDASNPTRFSVDWGGSLGVHETSLVVTLRMEYQTA